MPTKTKRKYPGIFITFEGIDGAGKSSHIDWLAQMLRAQGKNVVQSREPGGTPLGEQLRAILLRENMHPDTETLMLFTARREHLALVIEPALRQGHIVISDRFSDATYAYQCGGRGLSEVRFAALERWVHPDLQPDLTFLFDLAANVADERINRETRIRDRFEQEHASFHERVRDAYLRRARVMASRIRVIDAGRTMNEIRQELFQSLTDRLKEIESKTP